MWRCQFIDWLKFEACPSSLLNFGTVYCLLFSTLIFLEDHEAIVALVIVHPDFSSISAKSVSWCQASGLVEHSNCKFWWMRSIYIRNRDCKLWSTITDTPSHPLYQLLPPKKQRFLRNRGHDFVLPAVNTERFKRSFINRCLFNFI